MRYLFKWIALLLVGAFAAKVLGIGNLEQSTGYLQITTLLLAIGLYGCAFGIDLGEMKQHLKLIAAAVTIGVALKAAFIGGTLFLITGNSLFMIIGIALAQIDPLSVAALADSSSMSSRAKTILSAWSSFDDPVTTLLAIYTTTWFGSNASALQSSSNSPSHLGDIALNGTLIAGAFFAWIAVKNNRWIHLIPLAPIFYIAVDRALMIGISGAGLFLRPPIDGVISKVLGFALGLATIMLGAVLIDGINIFGGIALGVLTYVSQMIVGAILTRGLPLSDRLHLALAQQNGITAIVLALFLEVHFDGIIQIVAPAIVVVNTIHWLANNLLDKHYQTDVSCTAKLAHH